MKILMLGWELPPHNSGGLGVACYQMSKALASEGVDIDFIIPYTAKHPGIDYMNIYSATPLPPNYHDLGAYNNGSEEDRENAKDEYGLSPMRAVQRRYGKYVRKFVKNHQPDAIHAHDWLTMEVVEWVLAGEVQQDIVGLIHQAGGRAVGLTGRDGGLIRARKLRLPDSKDPAVVHDVGQVGEIVQIDPGVVQALQDDRFIPVVSPIGFGENNESYNINADVVAARLATVLEAEKLLMLTNIPGVLDRNGALLPELTAQQIEALCEDGTISGGMIPKIAGALDAARSGVNAVHIIDGRVPHAMLLEVLSDQAFGTMIRCA